MTLNESTYSKNFEALMDSARRIYSSSPDSVQNECPQSGMAIPHVADELEPETDIKFRQHLHDCRYCLDLVLDLRVAESEAGTSPKRDTKVLPVLSRTIESSKRKYAPMWPKFAAGVATAGLVFIIVNIGMNDSQLSDKFNKLSDAPVTEQDPVPAPSATGTVPKPIQNTPETQVGENPKTYEHGGKPDPFEALINNSTTNQTKRQFKRKRRTPRSPLEKLDLSQLKLVGILLSETGNRALLEDAAGKGYVIKKGTHIGINTGIVIDITDNKVIVLEEYEDVLGKLITQKKEIILQKPK